MNQTRSEADIKAAIFQVLHRIAPEAEPAQLDPNANLREALDIDSFDFLNFLIGLHEKLGVEIPEADYGKLTSLAALVSYLQTQNS
jgi:acyl carrier protein